MGYDSYTVSFQYGTHHAKQLTMSVKVHALGPDTESGPDTDSFITMANAGPKITGLSMAIYISEKNAPHGPRIKVPTSYGYTICQGSFSVTVEENPQVIGDVGGIKPVDVERVKEFVIVNKVA